MGAGSGAKPELPGASLEVLGRENGRSTTAIEQIPFKKNLRNPKKTRVASFSNLSRLFFTRSVVKGPRTTLALPVEG
jgi:hypothetical protein